MHFVCFKINHLDNKENDLDVFLLIIFIIYYKAFAFSS